MFDRMAARIRAIEAKQEEMKRAQPSEAVILCADLVLKYVDPPPQFIDKSQPPEKE